MNTKHPGPGLIDQLVRWNSIHWAALLISIVIAARPAVVFFGSVDELSASYIDVAEYCGLLLLKAFAPLALVGSLLNVLRLPKARTLLTAMLLGSGVVLWLQGNIFLWNYGKLDGRPLDFDGHTVHGLFEAALCLLTLVFAAAKHEAVSRHARTIALIVGTSAVAGIVLSYLERPDDPWHKAYQVTLDNYLTYSNRKNVILLVIDAARGDVFQELLSEMTEEEKRIFDGFTFFRNTSGTFNSTSPAVSGILTGQLYDYKSPRGRAYPEMFLSSSSIPRQLKRAGFVTEVYPYSMNSVFLSPEVVSNVKKRDDTGTRPRGGSTENEIQRIGLVAKFNFAPHFVKRLVFDPSEMYATAGPAAAATTARSQSGRDEKNAGLPQQVLVHLEYSRSILHNLASRLSMRPEPVFKYLHFHGAHPPFFHDENYAGVMLPFSMDSYRRQFKGSLLLTAKALIDSLKIHGVYENTMLVIMGDHGLYLPDGRKAAPEGAFDRRLVDSLTPLLMIKSFGEASSRLRISSAPVSLFDLPATVFEALGIPGTGAGRPVFAVSEHEKRARFAYAVALDRQDPDADKQGAFEYQIDGDAREPSSWKATGRFLRLHRGPIEIPDTEYRRKAAELKAYLDDGTRFDVKEGR